MNADGSGQRRISFGGGRYAAPDWSPDGDWIAFTRREPGGRRIGIMEPDGSGERLLTNGPGDEGASWAASSRELVFQRTDAGGTFGPLPHLARRQRAAAASPFRKTGPIPTGRE